MPDEGMTHKEAPGMAVCPRTDAMEKSDLTDIDNMV